MPATTSPRPVKPPKPNSGKSRSKHSPLRGALGLLRRIPGRYVLMLICAASLLFTLWKSPEAKLAGSLKRLASELSYSPNEAEAARLMRVERLEALFQEGAQLRAPELSANNRQEIIAAYFKLNLSRPQLYFEFEALEVTIDEAQANAVGQLNISEAQTGDLHREQRRLDLQLVQEKTGWKIKYLELSEKDRTPPWERP